MRRLAILLVILALAGCSSKAKTGANGVPSASGSVTPRAASSAPRSPSPKPDASGTSAAPSVSASTRSTSKPTSVGSAIVPAPGTYHYTQSGSLQVDSIPPFNADPQGTLAIGAPVADNGAKREQQERVYSSSWSQEQILLFRSTGVFIKSITSRVGSGAFVQEDVCSPSHPLKAIELPFVVGHSWSDSGTCNGRTLTLTGKVLRTESRTVGGTRVSTDVVTIVTHQTGGGYDVTLNLTMWIAAKYGLSVHATQTGKGTVQGSTFKENLTEDLDRLTPDP